jgi:uncharacterized delta-60 repeat protein
MRALLVLLMLATVVVESPASTSCPGAPLVRCLHAGDVDPTFGPLRWPNFIDFGNDVFTGISYTRGAQAMVILPDGKLLLAGDSSVDQGANHEPTLVRFTADGFLDTSFGSGGVVRTAVGPGHAHWGGIALQADGKVVVAGGTGLTYVTTTLLARYDENGNLDPTFGSGGLVIGTGMDGGFEDVTIQPDGMIVAAGRDGVELLVQRFDAKGALDETFGTAGSAVTSFGGFEAMGANAVALLADGSIVVGGGVQNGLYLGCALAMLDTHGNFDPVFGIGGQLKVPQVAGEVCYVSALTIDPSGMILAAGQYTTARQIPRRYFNLMRFNAAGSADVTFGRRGRALTSVYKPYAKTGSIGAYDVVVQPDGFIVEVGGLGGGDLGLARFRPDGRRLDTTFGSRGAERVDRAGIYGTAALDGAKAVRLLADGRIIVAGDLGGLGSFGVARLLGKACTYTVATSELDCP